MSNSRIELVLFNLTGSTSAAARDMPGVTLDLYADEPIALSLSNSNVRDITQKNTGFSKNFKLPGTSKNNRALGHIFSISSDSSFDPRKKVKAQLLVDSVPVFTGIFQLDSVTPKDGNQGTRDIMYSANLYEEQVNLMSQIEGLYIDELDFSEYDHKWVGSAITTSWTNNKGYIYPLLDLGSNYKLSDINGTYGELKGTDFYPATFAKTIWDKIFAGAGYSYSSSLISGSTFSNLVIPFNEGVNFSLPSSFATDRQFRAQMTINSFMNQPANPGTAAFVNLTADDDFTAPNFDNGGLYDIATYEYSADTLSFQQFTVGVKYLLEGSTNGITYSGAKPQIQVLFFRSTYNNYNVYDGFVHMLGLNPNPQTLCILLLAPANIYEVPFVHQPKCKTYHHDKGLLNNH